MLAFKTYLFITCGKNIRKQYKNNKHKITVPTWNEEFELPDDSYYGSDIKILSNISLKNMKY